jgi:flavin-dependent dehydrogenase
LLPILVIGAGPAGCASARLLASWGHEVWLIDRPGDDRRALAESIPPSTDRVLAALGMLTSVQDARFHPWLGNVVWWGREEPRVETFTGGAAGYQVVRSAFDRRLRDLATASGAQMRQGRVCDARLDGAGPSIVIEAGGSREQIRGSFLLDCSGRAGVVARPDFRRPAAGHRTIAMVAVWQAARWRESARANYTWVASYQDGWAWSVPTSPECRYVTVMIDPGRTGLLRRASSRDIYLRELAKVAPFAPELEAATLVDGPWGADATPYDAAQYAGANHLLVGDAGSFIDPLSSFGVKKALASGGLAAIVVHTALTRPEMREHALAFFDRREHDVFAAASRQAAAFAAASAHADRPFWIARASGIEDSPLAGDVDVAALARDEAVRAAFDDLRQRPHVRFRQGASIEIAVRPAVSGREIVLQEQIILPDAAHGVRFVRGIDLLALLRMAPDFDDVGQICEAISRERAGVALPDILGALSWLIARGALEPAEPPV